MELDPESVYKQDSNEHRVIEQYTLKNKIDVSQIQATACDKLIHPITGV